MGVSVGGGIVKFIAWFTRQSTPDCRTTPTEWNPFKIHNGDKGSNSMCAMDGQWPANGRNVLTSWLLIRSPIMFGWLRSERHVYGSTWNYTLNCKSRLQKHGKHCWVVHPCKWWTRNKSFTSVASGTWTPGMVLMLKHATNFSTSSLACNRSLFLDQH